MESVLIVSSQEKSRQLFEELLAQNGYRNFTAAGDAGEAGRLLLSRSFDLCVVNAPLSDGFGIEFAQTAVQYSTMQVLLFVKSELVERVSAKAEPYGVYVLGKPVNRHMLSIAMHFLTASHSRLLTMQKETVQLQRKLDDIRLIDRAKCTLIATLKLTEPQAHKYIEKQAMDIRKSRREVAEGILRTYEG